MKNLCYLKGFEIKNALKTAFQMLHRLKFKKKKKKVTFPLFHTSISTKKSESTGDADLKKQVPCIWLSDSSSEKVATDFLFNFLSVNWGFNLMEDGDIPVSVCQFIISFDCWCEQSDQEDANQENSEIKGTPKGRKKIRKIIEDVNLCAETQEALREEEERRKRLAERDSQRDMREVQQTRHSASLRRLNWSLQQSCAHLSTAALRKTAHSELYYCFSYESKNWTKQLLSILVFQVTEIEDQLSQVVCPITTKLVLDQDEETKNPLVQVHRNLVTKLKNHQVDGEFVVSFHSTPVLLLCETLAFHLLKGCKNIE